jgi:hypothetical protein
LDASHVLADSWGDGDAEVDPRVEPAEVASLNVLLRQRESGQGDKGSKRQRNRGNDEG